MLLFPAIDLRGGRCVRLYQGDFAAETVYADDPAAVAERFVEAGAPWLHVVDLDAARTGELANLAQVAAIVATAGSAGVGVQYGGGVRSVAAAQRLAGVGVARAVIGTAALENPGLVGEVAGVLPVALGLDVRGREIAVHGWRAGSGLTLADLLGSAPLDETAASAAAPGGGDRADHVGPARPDETAASAAAPGGGHLTGLLADGSAVEALVVTQIATDGTLAGPDVDLLTEVLESTDLPVVASGGVGDLDDLRRLAGLRVRRRSPAGTATGERALEGAIVGRAIYEGTLDLAEALSLLAEAPARPPQAPATDRDGRPARPRVDDRSPAPPAGGASPP